MTATIAASDSSTLATDKKTVRPFQKVNFPEAELTELRRRINATRWPDRNCHVCIARCAARDHSGAREVLGVRVTGMEWSKGRHA